MTAEIAVGVFAAGMGWALAMNRWHYRPLRTAIRKRDEAFRLHLEEREATTPAGRYVAGNKAFMLDCEADLLVYRGERAGHYLTLGLIPHPKPPRRAA